MNINTNEGALQALKSLRETNARYDQVSKRIQTGYKVADAIDDASSFSIAQGLRGDIKSYDAIQQSMTMALGTSKVALAGVTAISDLISSIRAKMTQLADESLTTEQRQIYTDDLTQMRSQVDDFLNNSTYNGVNLLKDDSEDVNYLANIDGSTVTIRANDIETAKADFDDDLDVSDAESTIDSMDALDAFETAVNTALGRLGADSRSVNFQNEFINTLRDATEVGLGAIVDADLTKESARLTALQTQQQLAIQALGIANQAPTLLLSLFR
ncbi:MAG: flagellin [Candidimonas sp.]